MSLDSKKLPDAWTVVALRQITEKPQYGFTTKATQAADGTRLLRITDIQDNSVDWSAVPGCAAGAAEVLKYGLAEGDIVFARTGATTGKSFLIRECPADAIFASYLIRLRSLEVVKPRFISYFFQSADYWSQVSASSAGIAQPGVNATKLEGLQVPFAPLPEQHRIVEAIESYLSRLDDAVASLERVQRNLKRYRASVLKAAVEGRLVPTEAELARSEGRDYEPASVLLERILKERRHRWIEDAAEKGRAKTEDKAKQAGKPWTKKDNAQTLESERTKAATKYKEPAAPDIQGLPVLPKGWCWSTVEQMGNVQLGRQRSPKNRSKDYPTKYIRAANITESGIDVSDVLDMEFTPSELVRYRMRKGDIVVSEASGSPDQVGKPAVWNDEIPVCCFQNTVIRLRPEGIDSEYLLVVFKHCYSNKVFAKIAGGVGINHLSAAKFSKVAVPLAPQMEQVRVAEEVERQLSVARKSEELVETTLKRAQRLRQSILKWAFEGKLVDQDPNDEPAYVLLERIQTERTAMEATDTKKKGRKRRSK